MAVSIDWLTLVITVPKADTTLVQSVPQEIRSLDVDLFRLELKSLEADVAGMGHLRTHVHNKPITVGGVTLARVIEIINGYTITFEDGQYAVNLAGGNTNIADVTNVNQVSVRSANSAGLVEITSGSGITEQDKLDIADRVWDETMGDHTTAGSTGESAGGTRPAQSQEMAPRHNFAVD